MHPLHVCELRHQILIRWIYGADSSSVCLCVFFLMLGWGCGGARPWVERERLSRQTKAED